MNKKKPEILSNVSDRDKALLFLLLSILFLAFAYFFVFKGYMEKTEQVRSENTDLEYYISELDQKLEKKDEILADIKTYDEDRAKVVDRFAPDYTIEKANVIIADMEEATGVFFDSVGFSMKNLYFSQEESESAGLIQRESVISTSSFAQAGVPEKEYPKLTGYCTEVNVNYSVTNADFDKMIAYVNEQSDKMSIKTISVTVDESNGDLTGSMVLCLYSADGTDKTYEAPNDLNVSTGVANIFGAKKK